MQQRQDSLGFRWDISNRGGVEDGLNDCFDGGLYLLVNGMNFNSTQQMMTKDGADLVLSNPNINNISVTRRIWVNSKEGYCRYLEVFENSGQGSATVTVTVRSRLGSQGQQTLSSAGLPFGGTLDKKDVGLMAMTNGRPCVMFLLGEQKSEAPVTPMVMQNRDYTFNYTLTIKPKETASILHYVAQRTSIMGNAVPDLFNTFYKRKLLVDPHLSKELAKTVRNFNIRNGGDSMDVGPAFQHVVTLLESMDVERGASDILVMDNDTRLSGTLTTSPFTVETRYGLSAINPEEVAILWGGAGIGRG
ncbi:MAG: hypothetical protein JXR97_08455, partial [Planctomycetes bacterium]|nr:hypothetical protein [Planctomycetota bacterium]